MRTLEPHYKQTCRRKVKHFSLKAAYDALRRVRADEYCENPRALNVYKCSNHWHVGHRTAQFTK